jgi:hypothetical protein
MARPTRDGREGYAVVDALVALMIISLAAVLSFRALDQADRSAKSGQEVRRAQVLASRLMDAMPRTYKAATGETDGFTWRLETNPTGADRPIEVCHRWVKLTNVSTRRTYEIATLETCPLEEFPSSPPTS